MGFYRMPGSFHQYGFVLLNGTYQSFSDPQGTEATQLTGANANSVLTGLYFQTDFVGGFIFRNNTFENVVLPGATFTHVQGINALGTITGDGYHQETGFSTGFTATCQSPPPSSCQPPTSNGVVICSPANNSTVSSPVHVQASAYSSAGIKYMQVYIDGSKYQDFPGVSSIDVQIAMGAGTHRMVVQARDANGSVYKQAVYVTVSASSSSCQPPTANGVAICSPANNSTVSSPVHVQASAFSSAGIKYMQVYIDGSKYQDFPGVSSIDVQIAMGAGTHRIVVQAADGSGSVYKQAVYVTVQ